MEPPGATTAQERDGALVTGEAAASRLSHTCKVQMGPAARGDDPPSCAGQGESWDRQQELLVPAFGW